MHILMILDFFVCMQALGFKPGVVTTGNSLDHVPEDDRIMAENGKMLSFS